MRKGSLIKINRSGLAFVLIAFILGPVFSMPSQVSAEQLAKDVLLKIYLPREITIEDKSINLSEIGILRGDKAAVSKAGDIALGNFSVPGQDVVIDRVTILSRLASHGYPASKVLLAGSLNVNVKQRQRVIKGSEFIKAGRLFLKENPPCGSICQIDPVTIPKDCILDAGQADIRIISRLVKSMNKSQAKVRVGIFVDGKEVAARDVTFRFKFNCRKAVAVTDIPAGAAITAENIKIEKKVSNYPEPEGFKPPYGLVARRRISVNSIVDNMAVSKPESAVVIERNQTVTIRAETQGLLITAMGTALQKGHAGEYIRVRNVDSKRIIFAKVCGDGTVEPVF